MQPEQKLQGRIDLEFTLKRNGSIGELKKAVFGKSTRKIPRNLASLFRARVETIFANWYGEDGRPSSAGRFVGNYQLIKGSEKAELHLEDGKGRFRVSYGYYAYNESDGFEDWK